jgi:hypothetical protein
MYLKWGRETNYWGGAFNQRGAWSASDGRAGNVKEGIMTLTALGAEIINGGVGNFLRRGAVNASTGGNVRTGFFSILPSGNAGNISELGLG